MTIRGPLSYFYSGGAAESEGPAADQNDRGTAAGAFGGLGGEGGSTASAQAGAGRSVMEKALDFTAIGQIVGAMNRAGAATIAAGGPSEARGASTGSGYGGNEAVSGVGLGGASAGGNNDAGTAPPVAPTDPAAGATPSTRYIPGTGDYERILIRKDGTRTDLAGNPLAFAGGGATGGRSADGAPVSGLFAGGTPGRADLLDTMLPEDAYILPADTVSAAGEGNTEAGALSLARHFGQPLVKHAGLSTGPIRAKVSSGEFYVSPADVDKAGGADALDKMVRNLRKHYAKNLSALPGPKK